MLIVADEHIRPAHDEPLLPGKRFRRRDSGDESWHHWLLGHPRER
jgi:hypothetical protein